MNVRIAEKTFSSKSKRNKSKRTKGSSKKKAPERVLGFILNPRYAEKGVSFKTIAKCTKLSSRQYASSIVNRLEAEGKIIVAHTAYKHPRMPNAKCCGKNLYSPGPNAPKRFQKPLESEKNELKSEEKISKNYDTNISSKLF